MMKFIYHIIFSCFLLFSINLTSQVGIGTVSPDTSAILDLYSTDRGLLVPRLTVVERDLITNPANGLMIYNTTSSEMQVNNGSPVAPFWGGLGGGGNTAILSLTDAVEFSTVSLVDELISGVTLSPPAGDYLVLFNAQFGLLDTEPLDIAQGVTDLTEAYTEIMALSATQPNHDAIFGNGETLAPGVYNSLAAASIAGTLTLDGGNDANSIFIIRIGGALTAGAGAEVILTGGASANNIFWVAEGAIALAAGVIMKGTLIANNAAVALAAGMDLEGRMFSTSGAVSFGPGTAYVPTGTSYIDLGVLSTFVMFSSAGAIANTGISSITGDVGSNAGAIAGFEDLNGSVYGAGLVPNSFSPNLVTFSIYLDGALVANSTRSTNINTAVIALQTFVNVGTNQIIDIRWRVDEGGVVIGNRVLSMIKAN